MDVKDLANTIAKFTPYLGAAITTANPVAGLLVSLIGSAFGVDTKKESIDSLISKINSDASAEFKLKQIQLDHEDALFSKEVEDRESAREREESVLRSTGKRDWLMELIALLVIAGYFIMCSLLIFNKVDDKGNMQIIYMMFGQLTGGFIMVLSYYFGTSKQFQPSGQ